MGVEAEGVGELDAVDEAAELGADAGAAGVGGVDVEPEAVAGGEFAELGEAVDGGGRGGADGGAEVEGDEAGGDVGRDGRAEGGGGEGEGVGEGGFDGAEVGGGNAGDLCGFLKRAVGLVGAVDDQLGDIAVVPARETKLVTFVNNN